MTQANTAWSCLYEAAPIPNYSRSQRSGRTFIPSPLTILRRHKTTYLSRPPLPSPSDTALLFLWGNLKISPNTLKPFIHVAFDSGPGHHLNKNRHLQTSWHGNFRLCLRPAFAKGQKKVKFQAEHWKVKNPTTARRQLVESDRSAGKLVDPSDGRQVVVPVRALGPADMRVGSYVDRAVKRPCRHSKKTNFWLENWQRGPTDGAKALHVA